jgi:KipI family sensor histidine kinase inhibitor
MADVRFVSAGDAALIVEFPEVIDPQVNARVVALAAAIARAGVPGVRDVVPTYRSVAVYFDPLRTDRDAFVAELEKQTEAALGRHAFDASDAGTQPVQIPVVYGGDEGPDLSGVAAFAGLSEREVVRLHTARVYRVYMLGFVPGFAYMGSVDSRIAAPRHATPRLRVPAGSVAIAGAQTAIYPSETPGGWQLIGRTGVRLFDLSRPDPFLLEAGSSVRFCEA